MAPVAGVLSSSGRIPLSLHPCQQGMHPFGGYEVVPHCGYLHVPNDVYAYFQLGYLSFC